MKSSRMPREIEQMSDQDEIEEVENYDDELYSIEEDQEQQDEHSNQENSEEEAEEVPSYDLDELKNERMTPATFFDFSIENKAGKQKQKSLGNNSSFIKQKPVASNEILESETSIKDVDYNEFEEYLTKFKGTISEVKLKWLPLLGLVRNHSNDLKNGMSYLDTKFDLLSFYCLDLVFSMLVRIQGRSLKDHSVLKRLIYIKTLLTRTKTLDKKLDYQITKLLRLANRIERLLGENFNAEDGDPLSLRPNPEKMTQAKTIEDIDMDQHGGDLLEDEPNASKKVYRAPKLRPMLMKEEAEKNREEREEYRRKKKLLKSEFLRDLQEEFGDEPLEIKMNKGMLEEEDEEDVKRRRFEEENFKRIQLTKKEKQRAKDREKKREARSKIDDFTEFDQIRDALREETERKKAMSQQNEIKMKKAMSQFFDKRRKSDHRDDFEDNDFRSMKKLKKENDGIDESMFLEVNDKDGSVEETPISKGVKNHNKFKNRGKMGNKKRGGFN